jgi:hypothetical protein
MGKKIVIYTTDYWCKDVKRRREIRGVLNSNAKLDFVAKIVILYENWDQVSKEDKEKEYNYLNVQPKFQVVNWPTRQTYKDLIEHSRKHNPDNIIVITNSDILFDRTLERCNECIFDPKRVYALSRWDRLIQQGKVQKAMYVPPFQSRPDMNWSYDTYVFKHPLSVLTSTLDIEVGVGGCDTYLVKKLTIDNGCKVENPMMDIRCWHEDYRQEEQKEKDYQHKINYNTYPDYPGAQNPTFPVAPTLFGGAIGLEMKHNFGVSPLLTAERQIHALRKGLKLISYSLYGSIPKYTRGAILNAEQALDVYPGWRCWFYVQESTVPKEIVDELRTYPNVDIIMIQEQTLGMTWRFTAIDEPDVEVMIVRDTDSQLSTREALAVEEWLQSGQSLHIIRDHPNHGTADGHRICGGLWGMRKVGYWPGWKQILPRYKQYEGQWGLDQDVLSHTVYPLFSTFNDIMVHASFNKFESDAREFPVPFNADCNFIGEYHYYTGERNLEHAEMIRSSLATRPIKSKTNKMKVTHIIATITEGEKCIEEKFKCFEKVWSSSKSRSNVKIMKCEQRHLPSLVEQLIRDNITTGILCSSLNCMTLDTEYILQKIQQYDEDRCILWDQYMVASPFILREVFQLGGLEPWNIQRGGRLIKIHTQFTRCKQPEKLKNMNTIRPLDLPVDVMIKGEEDLKCVKLFLDTHKQDTPEVVVLKKTK